MCFGGTWCEVVCMCEQGFISEKLGDFCFFVIVQGHVINAQVPPTLVGASVH